MFQSLFGERAPASRNGAAASHVLAMCHELARQEKNTDARDATRTNQFGRDGIILWKSFDLSSNDAISVIGHRSRAEFSGLLESSHPQAWKRCSTLARPEGAAFVHAHQLRAEERLA
jgi:hypothetical protein